jgi:hypothetical protein
MMLDFGSKYTNLMKWLRNQGEIMANAQRGFKALFLTNTYLSLREKEIQPHPLPCRKIKNYSPVFS